MKISSSDPKLKEFLDSLGLRYAGDPVLYQQCHPVKRVNGAVRRLSIWMMNIMYEHKGVGLAAPQIGMLDRIFVLDTTPVGGKAKGTYVNPEVISESEEKQVCEEGCLSFPGVSILVERPRSIKVRYLNLENQNVIDTLEGIDAQAFLHELEHLDGKVIADRDNFPKDYNIN